MEFKSNNSFPNDKLPIPKPYSNLNVENLLTTPPVSFDLIGIDQFAVAIGLDISKIKSIF